MDINLSKLNYSFKRKPLLVGGKAMEYYGLRQAGTDIDFLADEEDIRQLIKLYPDRVKNLYSDLGVCPLEFEIWRTIRLFSYDDLFEDAIDKGDYLVISIEKLLLMKALAMEQEKYLKDTQLIAAKISKDQYEKFDQEKSKVAELLSGVENVTYLEKVGPNK